MNPVFYRLKKDNEFLGEKSSIAKYQGESVIIYGKDTVVITINPKDFPDWFAPLMCKDEYDNMIFEGDTYFVFDTNTNKYHASCSKIFEFEFESGLYGRTWKLFSTKDMLEEYLKKHVTEYNIGDIVVVRNGQAEEKVIMLTSIIPVLRKASVEEIETFLKEQHAVKGNLFKINGFIDEIVNIDIVHADKRNTVHVYGCSYSSDIRFIDDFIPFPKSYNSLIDFLVTNKNNTNI